METIKVNTYDFGGETEAVDIDGEIDVSTSPRIKDILNTLIDTGHHNLVLNLERVRYIDSTGLVAFISALKRVREKQGKIVLICTNPHILKIFNITGLSNVFEIFSSPDEAARVFHTVP